MKSMLHGLLMVLALVGALAGCAGVSHLVGPPPDLTAYAP